MLACAAAGEYGEGGISKLVLSCDRTGRNGCHFAASTGNIELLKALVDAGCNCGGLDDTGRSPLVYAVRKASKVVSEWLLEQSLKGLVSVHGPPDKNLLTPLHHAVLGKCVDIVPLLLQYGASPYMKDSLEKTPLDLAAFICDKLAKDGDSVGLERATSVVQMLQNHRMPSPAKVPPSPPAEAQVSPKQQLIITGAPLLSPPPAAPLLSPPPLYTATTSTTDPFVREPSPQKPSPTGAKERGLEFEVRKAEEARHSAVIAVEAAAFAARTEAERVSRAIELASKAKAEAEIAERAQAMELASRKEAEAAQAARDAMEAENALRIAAELQAVTKAKEEAEAIAFSKSEAEVTAAMTAASQALRLAFSSQSGLSPSKKLPSQPPSPLKSSPEKLSSPVSATLLISPAKQASPRPSPSADMPPARQPSPRSSPSADIPPARQPSPRSSPSIALSPAARQPSPRSTVSVDILPTDAQVSSLIPSLPMSPAPTAIPYGLAPLPTSTFKLAESASVAGTAFTSPPAPKFTSPYSAQIAQAMEAAAKRISAMNAKFSLPSK